MELKENMGSDKSWMYQCPADYADEEAKPEVFAIRFKDSEHAQKFKTEFDKAREHNRANAKEESETPAPAEQKEAEQKETEPVEKKEEPTN